jgi:hypothetical protein
MAKIPTALGVIFFGLCTAAAAQTPGIGDTRPMPPEKKTPAASEAHKAPAEASGDRELKRCDDFSGTRREDCLRDLRAAEGRAAAGASRRPEPPTAPPPTNPAGR